MARACGKLATLTAVIGVVEEELGGHEIAGSPGDYRADARMRARTVEERCDVVRVAFENGE